MNDPRESLPSWAVQAIGRPVVSTASARAAIMTRIRREAAQRPAAGHVPGTLHAPMHASRWRRRGLLSPFGAAAMAAVLGLMLTVRSLGTLAASRDQEVTPGLKGEATTLGDTVLPSLRDTMRIVEFVLHGHALSNVAVMGDFNAWGRNATMLAKRDDSTWSARALLPRESVHFAYVASAAKAASARGGVRDVTMMLFGALPQRANGQ